MKAVLMWTIQNLRSLLHSFNYCALAVNRGKRSPGETCIIIITVIGDTTSQKLLYVYYDGATSGTGEVAVRFETKSFSTGYTSYVAYCIPSLIDLFIIY
jgi:hypothetical protein